MLLTIEQGVERGLDRDALLEGTGITNAALAEPNGHVPFLDYGRLVARVLRWSGDGGLGYDFGLRANLAAHGFAGFGVMNHRTLREAVVFGIRYLMPLRTPGFTTRGFVDGEYAVIEVNESVDYGPLRQYAFDMLLVGMTHLSRPFIDLSELELWFACAEPEYYARYRHRLPPARFEMGANQIRCPIKLLDRATDIANPVTAQLVIQQCEREMALLQRAEPVLGRVRAALSNASGAYPDLEAVASQLSMSSRTLKRRLNQHGFSFRRLKDEVKQRDSVKMLQDTTLSVEEVAFRLGYTAQGNFIRAFRAWTGTTPSAFRKRGVANRAIGHGAP